MAVFCHSRRSIGPGKSGDIRTKPDRFGSRFGGITGAGPQPAHDLAPRDPAAAALHAPRPRAEYCTMPLTDLELRNLQPAERTNKRADGLGLYIEVTPKGSKLWRWK